MYIQLQKNSFSVPQDIIGVDICNVKRGIIRRMRQPQDIPGPVEAGGHALRNLLTQPFPIAWSFVWYAPQYEPPTQLKFYVKFTPLPTDEQPSWYVFKWPERFKVMLNSNGTLTVINFFPDLSEDDASMAVTATSGEEIQVNETTSKDKITFTVMKVTFEKKKRSVESIYDKWSVFGWQYEPHDDLTSTIKVYFNGRMMKKTFNSKLPTTTTEPRYMQMARADFSCLENPAQLQPDTYYADRNFAKCSKLFLCLSIYI